MPDVTFISGLLNETLIGCPGDRPQMKNEAG